MAKEQAVARAKASLAVRAKASLVVRAKAREDSRSLEVAKGLAGSCTSL